MASPSTWRWSNHSAIRLSSFYHSSTSRGRNKTTHLSVFCLDDSSSSPSPSSSASMRTRTRRSHRLVNSTHNSNSDLFSSAEKRKKSTPIGRSPDGSFFLVEKSKIRDSKGDPAPQLQLRRLRLKLFGKKPLWKRIFFASKKVRSIILLNVLTLIYASNIPVVKEVEEIMDPALFTVVRFAVSSVPFLPFVLKARDDSKTRSAGLELGFWVSLGYLFQALGLLTSDAGRASFISAFTVIAVPLIDGILGTQVPTLTWFGALVSLTGVGMLESSGSSPSVGDFFNILSAVFFGIHMLRTEHISRNTKKEKYLALLGYEVCVVAVLSAMWYLICGGFGDIQKTNPSSWVWTSACDWVVSFPWIPALYTGIFSTGLCLWIEIAAMRDVSATETAIIYGLEPLWGAAFAWFLLGERWGTVGWIGAALVMVGSLTVQIWGSSPKKPKDDEETNRQYDCQQISDKQSDFSGVPVVVSPRENVTGLSKKQDRPK